MTSEDRVAASAAGTAPVGDDLDVRVARELIDKARADGVSLVGPNGLLRQLTKTVLEAALNAELDEHLGYEKGDRVGKFGANERNGSSAKTVRTDVGEVRIDVPRDREGTFTPQIVPKYARRVEGVVGRGHIRELGVAALPGRGFRRHGHFSVCEGVDHWRDPGAFV